MVVRRGASRRVLACAAALGALSPWHRWWRLVPTRRPGPLGDGVAFAGARSRVARPRRLGRLLRGSGTWLEVARGPGLEPDGERRVLPVFPTPTIVWPGNTLQFGVIEPAHIQLYEELLMSGAREVLAPLTRMPKSTCGPDSALPPQTCWLTVTAAVLRLEELKEVSDRTGGAMKYVATHSVRGRAAIRRILNPTALFETNGKEERVDYLRVEADMLPDEEADTPRDVGADADPLTSHGVVGDLAKAWENLRELAEKLDEPRIDGSARELIAASSTWRLADLWYKLRLKLQTHREQARIATAVNFWVQAEQEQGRLHKTPSEALEAMPRALLEEVRRMNSPMGLKFGLDFYEPFLRLLATDGAPARAEALVEMAREELRSTRARVSLQDLLH